MKFEKASWLHAGGDAARATSSSVLGISPPRAMPRACLKASSDP